MRVVSAPKNDIVGCR